VTLAASLGRRGRGALPRGWSQSGKRDLSPHCAPPGATSYAVSAFALRSIAAPTKPLKSG